MLSSVTWPLYSQLHVNSGLPAQNQASLNLSVGNEGCHETPPVAEKIL